MIYIKFNYKGAWFFYGPWKEVAVHYGCEKLDSPMVFSFPGCDLGNTTIVDEIFKNDQKEKPSCLYTIITGWEEGQYKAIALLDCKAYLLTSEGKTLEKIIT